MVPLQWATHQDSIMIGKRSFREHPEKVSDDSGLAAVCFIAHLPVKEESDGLLPC
jgi:hypothetical protein